MADPIKHTPETKSVPSPVMPKPASEKRFGEVPLPPLEKRFGETDADYKARVNRTPDEPKLPRRFGEEAKPLVRTPRKPDDKAKPPQTHEERLAENRARNKIVVEDKRHRGVSEPEIYEDVNEDAKLNSRGPMPGESEEAFRVRTNLDKSKDI